MASLRITATLALCLACVAATAARQAAKAKVATSAAAAKKATPQRSSYYLPPMDDCRNQCDPRTEVCAIMYANKWCYSRGTCKPYAQCITAKDVQRPEPRPQPRQCRRLCPYDSRCQFVQVCKDVCVARRSYGCLKYRQACQYVEECVRVFDSSSARSDNNYRDVVFVETNGNRRSYDQVDNGGPNPRRWVVGQQGSQRSVLESDNRDDRSFGASRGGERRFSVSGGSYSNNDFVDRRDSRDSFLSERRSVYSDAGSYQDSGYRGEAGGYRDARGPNNNVNDHPHNQPHANAQPETAPANRRPSNSDTFDGVFINVKNFDRQQNVVSNNKQNVGAGFSLVYGDERNSYGKAVLPAGRATVGLEVDGYGKAVLPAGRATVGVEVEGAFAGTAAKLDQILDRLVNLAPAQPATAPAAAQTLTVEAPQLVNLDMMAPGVSGSVSGVMGGNAGDMMVVEAAGMGNGDMMSANMMSGNMMSGGMVAQPMMSEGRMMSSDSVMSGASLMSGGGIVAGDMMSANSMMASNHLMAPGSIMRGGLALRSDDARAPMGAVAKIMQNLTPSQVRMMASTECATRCQEGWRCQDERKLCANPSCEKEMWNVRPRCVMVPVGQGGEYPDGHPLDWALNAPVPTSRAAKAPAGLTAAAHARSASRRG